MKLPVSWLLSHVEADLGVDELVEVMSLHGLEVEAVTTPGLGVEGVATARVLEHRPHPDADSLRVVRVTGEGGDGEVEVVCGASNFDVGNVVAHARPGGAVVAADRSGAMRLEARAIRGVVSNGMLASPRELGLGDDHSGLLLLPSGTPLGAELTDLVPVGEAVIEIAVQPDRGDHLSVVGVARDLAAILDTRWGAPEVPARPGPGDHIPVDIATDGCERFVTWVLDEVVAGPSPLWMVHRLAQCGLRSIDVVVDATNLVMLELGHPLHAFDLGQLRGQRLRVHDAVGGEALRTIDGEQRTLAAGDLAISDAERVVSLAGVMGGADTEVTSATRRVLLEAAVWDPRRIRATSRRHGLASEASQRFERRVDPLGTERAAARAAALLIDHAGAVASGGDAVAGPSPWPLDRAVRLDVARTAALLGVSALDADTQKAVLLRAGCAVDGDDQVLEVIAPSWRGDLGRPADLAEEIARLHGYDTIPAELPTVRTGGGGLSPAQRVEREVRAAVLAAGFHEAVTRPFVGDAALPGVVPTAGRVTLANPLAKDASAMRPSLLEGLLGAVRRNVGQGRPGIALAELGRVFRPADDPLADVLDELAAGDDWRWRAPDGAVLPVQPRALGLAAQGVRLGERWLDPAGAWSVEDVLATFDEVLARLLPRGDAGGDWTWHADGDRPGLHPGRAAVLRWHGAEVGIAGQLHPTEARRRDLPEPVVVGELLLEPFLRAVPAGGHPLARAAALARHPALTIDVALVAADEVPYATLEEAIVRGAGDLLDAHWWFDEYRGEQLGDGRRSVTVRLRLQDPARQLTGEDEERVIEAIAAAAQRVGATLRR